MITLEQTKQLHAILGAILNSDGLLSVADVPRVKELAAFITTDDSEPEPDYVYRVRGRVHGSTKVTLVGLDQSLSLAEAKRILFACKYNGAYGDVWIERNLHDHETEGWKYVNR